MKVNPINTYKPSYITKKLNNNVENNNHNITNTATSLVIKPNEVAFLGQRKDLDDIKAMKQMKRNFTPEAEGLYEMAEQVAKQMGSPNIETYHLYYASLLALKNYINELDSGVISYDEESRFKLPFEVQKVISPSCNAFADEKSRAKIAEVVDKHLVETQNNFIIPNAKSKGIRPPFLSNPSPSKATIDDLADSYDVLANAAQTNTYLDCYFLVTASYSKDRKLVREAKAFDTDLQRALMVEDSDKKKKNHLQFYDDKADTIWKNISVGNDAICLCSLDNKESANHLVSSFVNLINKPGNSYKNINKEDTEIVVLNRLASFEFLNKLTKEVKTSPDKKDKTTVVVADLANLIKNSNGTLFEDDIRTLINASETKDGDKRDLRFVFTMSPEAYYANTANGALLSSVLSQYAVQTLPSLNAADAIKFLTDENGINFIQNETNIAFKPETIRKAIELTTQDEGNFPDKAIGFLSGASKYYVDKTEITPEDLEKYSIELKGLSEVSNKSDGMNIIYDTGKKLSDIVGSPMTKADAETIVEQIKSGTIGTKGFSAYLENGSSYGGGRRHTAEAIAGEAGIPMININAQDFSLKDIDALSQSANLSEMKIKKIVSAAKAQAEANENKAAMIFIENFDCFGADPMTGIPNIYGQKAFSQLLAEMDNARKNDDVNLIVVGSLNMPTYIDPNIMKPYRFLNSIIVFPPQDANEREEVLDYYIKKDNIEVAGDTKEEQEKTIRGIAETTQGFTVVDILALLDTVKSVASERKHDKVDSADFTEAYLRTVSGRSNKAHIPDATKKVVTSHEAGHAIALQVMYEIAEKQNIPWHLPNKVNFITLDPRANFGGAMYYKPSDNHEFSFERVMSDIVCSYGGHSSEKNIYNMSGSWGITGDMQSAESTARMAVLDMGMGPRTGVRHIRRNALGSPDVSQEKLREIEMDMDSFMGAAKRISDSIIETYKDFILEFTEKYSSKVGTGECIVSSEQFQKELNEWRNRQSEETKAKLVDLEKEVLDEMEKVKNPKLY